MTDEHARALELAAAAIDFTLDAGEQAALDAHLDACPRCRRRAFALGADQRSLESLPRIAPTQAVSAHVLRTLQRGHRSSAPTLRLLLAASLVALLALSSVVIGAGYLRREPPPDLSVVPTPGPATPEPTQPPADSPSPTESPTPSADASGPPVVGYAAGTVVEVVTTGLRVRTNPTVDNAVSAKLDPLLGPGARLRVVEGPVNADDYDWYRIEAIDLPHVGWVAAADHDGEAWIADPSQPTPTPATTWTVAESDLLAALRADAAETCVPRRVDLPTQALAGIECEIRSGVATRVGAYAFRDAADATLTYLTRLAEYGVAPSSGDCAAGIEGDVAWAATDGSTGRMGCFLNENDIANVRLTCDRLYVGVLGRAADLEALHAWAGGSTGAQLAAAPDLCRPATS